MPLAASPRALSSWSPKSNFSWKMQELLQKAVPDRWEAFARVERERSRRVGRLRIFIPELQVIRKNKESKRMRLHHPIVLTLLNLQDAAVARNLAMNDTSIHARS